MLSCLVIGVTHETVGWVSIVLIWLGHVTITGAELWQSAADWGFQSELSDHRRLGTTKASGASATRPSRSSSRACSRSSPCSGASPAGP